MPDMIATARVTPSRKRGGGLLKKVLSASNYGHFTAAKQFWSQCHIFRGYMITGINKRRIKKSFGEGLENIFVWPTKN